MIQAISWLWMKAGSLPSAAASSDLPRSCSEMVSLGAIELMVQKLWPEAFHAAVAVEDKRKGERIVLVTTKMPALREELRDYSRRFGATELMVPNEIINVPEIPVLGSGKTDYVTAQKIADEWIKSHHA